MLNKTTTNIFNVGFLFIIFFGIVSCEKDFENIAIDIVDNGKFEVGDSILEIISYNVDVEKNRVDNNGSIGTAKHLNLLGVHSDAIFGHEKAAIISQFAMPSSGVDFGDNAKIDLVVLDMPYMLKDEELDSVYGDVDKAYHVTINELGTFLNTLDPNDPTKEKKYYSDDTYLKLDELFTGDFKPNVNDTVLYVERKEIIIGEENGNPIYDVDTIKADNAAPSIKFTLDSEFFKTKFVDQDDSSHFDNINNFRHYFRGLYIDADGTEGSVMNLNTDTAKITIYYTNDVEDEDGNIVRTKQSINFVMLGVKSNRYTRDYSSSVIEKSLLNPDMVNGSEQLYIQGAAGSEAILDIISEEAVEEIKSKNWLINDAVLTMYIDEEQNEIPQRLFLYNHTYNSTIVDMHSPVFGEVFGGELEYKDGVPEKYTFRITKYLTDLLKEEPIQKPSKLAVKNYVNTDRPELLADTIVKDYNWIPKGVILKGNLPKEDESRIQLKIFYSK